MVAVGVVASVAAIPMFASGVKLLHREDPCACLAWKDVYTTTNVTCGEAFEGVFAGRTGTDVTNVLHVPLEKMMADKRQEYCISFFQKIVEPLCFNIHQEANDYGQWCYVSSECAELHDGLKMESAPTVAWKKCKSGQDPLTRQWQVEDLAAWAQKSDINVELAAKMSYPVWRDFYKSWELLRETFASQALDGPIDVGTFSVGFAEELRTAIADGKPVIFTSQDHHPPFGILEGTRIYEVHKEAEYASEKAYEHPGQMSSITLLRG